MRASPSFGEADLGQLDLNLDDLGLPRASATSGLSPTTPPTHSTTSAPAKPALRSRLGLSPWGARAASSSPDESPAATSHPSALPAPRTSGFLLDDDEEDGAAEAFSFRGLTPFPTTAPREATSQETAAREAEFEAPVVKRIAFPTSAPSSTDAAPTKSSNTQFSRSIGPPRAAIPPRPAFESDDDLAPPEDLPEALPRPIDPSKSLAELWSDARRAFAKTSQGAAHVSARGRALRAHLAGEVKKVWRARRVRAAAPPAEVASASAPRAKPPTRTEKVRPFARALDGGEFDRKAFFHTTKKIGRKLAPVLGAVGIATVVSVGSGHFLGESGVVGLSRATGVPDLGTLPETTATAEGAPGASVADRVREKRGAPVEATKRPKDAPPAIEVVPLPEGLSYPGKGLVEVVTGEEELIYVDGVFIGRGPLRRVPVSPGNHAVAIRNGGDERRSEFVVELTRTTRIAFVEPAKVD